MEKNLVCDIEPSQRCVSVSVSRWLWVSRSGACIGLGRIWDPSA